jgi:hypothetical protein
MKITSAPGILFTLALSFATIATAAPVTFAQATQSTPTNQIHIQNNPNGTVVVSSSVGAQDNFQFLVAGTPFGVAQAVTANFFTTATSSSSGACGSSGCPTGDSFTEQGFTGNFSYTVATGVYAGRNLLSGSFNTNATPTNSGGKFGNIINGTGGSFNASQTPTNLNGIVLTSDFLDFTTVTQENGTWALSSLSPNFSVNPTANTISFPTTAQDFVASATATFSSQPAPVSTTPEPATMGLIGSSLTGMFLIRRKRLSR